MKLTIKSILKLVFPLLLGIVLVWYSLQKISIETLIVYFKKANYNWIIFGVFLGVLSHLSRAYRWKYLTQPLGYSLGLPNSIMAVLSAYLINYTIPRAGEISRATIVANYEGIPFEKGFGTIISERLVDVLIMLCIIAIALILEFDLIIYFLFQDITPTNKLANLLVIALMLIVFYMVLARGKHLILIKIRTFLLGVIDGVTSILKMKNKVFFIAHTLFIWGMYVLMFYITSLSIDQTAELPFSAILIGFILASFSIAATNGGIGSYPIAVYAAFSLFNASEEASLAFGWIMWASQTSMIIILGGLSILILPIYNSLYKKKLDQN